ncbi:hypothetical protein Tco_0302417, partial [Tanacetum coccineum]
MSIYKVPMGVLEKLESIRRNFFNCTDGSVRKSSWTTLGIHGALGCVLRTHQRFTWTDIIHAIQSLNDKGINLFQFIQKKIGNGEKTLFWDDIWSGDIAFKEQFKRLYALEVSKSISFAEKLGHPSICHSFRQLPRGGIEQELYNLLCSKVDT